MANYENEKTFNGIIKDQGLDKPAWQTAAHDAVEYAMFTESYARLLAHECVVDGASPVILSGVDMDALKVVKPNGTIEPIALQDVAEGQTILVSFEESYDAVLQSELGGGNSVELHVYDCIADGNNFFLVAEEGTFTTLEIGEFIREDLEKNGIDISEIAPAEIDYEELERE